MKIVLGIFIGWENRVTFGQKRVTIGFCNSQKFWRTTKNVSRLGKTWNNPPFFKIYLPNNRVTFWPTCHDL